MTKKGTFFSSYQGLGTPPARFEPPAHFIQGKRSRTAAGKEASGTDTVLACEPENGYFDRRAPTSFVNSSYWADRKLAFTRQLHNASRIHLPLTSVARTRHLQRQIGDLAAGHRAYQDPSPIRGDYKGGERAALAPSQPNPHASWASGSSSYRINKTSSRGNFKALSKVVSEKGPEFLQLINQMRQDREREAELIQMKYNAGNNRQLWSDQVGCVSSTTSMEYHSSDLKPAWSPPNLMSDHRSPAGHAYDGHSPDSMPADSPASYDEAAMSFSMFPGPHMTTETGYGGNELHVQDLTGIKVEPEGAIRYYRTKDARNLSAAGHGFELRRSPSTSPPGTFQHWNQTVQSSDINSGGFLAQPQHFMAGPQGLHAHGLPAMPVLTSSYTPRGMESAMPNFNPSIMEHGTGLGASINGNRSGSLANFDSRPHHSQSSMAVGASDSFSTVANSPDTMGSFFSDSFGENYELSSSGQHFVLQAGAREAAIHPCAQPQVQQHHQVPPTIVFPDGHSSMDSLGNYAPLDNSGFGNQNPTWTQPSPSMATSTDSLPRVMMASLAQQQDNFGLLTHPGSTPTYSQAPDGQWVRGSSRVNEATGLTQAPASKPQPRRPLPSSRGADPSKDKRVRQISRSRSRSPAAQTSTQGSGRPRKQAKRQANLNTSPPVRSSTTAVANPMAKAAALVTNRVPAYMEQQHINGTVPLAQPPALVPLPTLSSNTVPAWSLMNITNPTIPDEVYRNYVPNKAKGTGGTGTGRRTTSTMRRDDPWLIERRKKDEYIVQHKDSGWTYSQIKQAGGFTEAESTLRGRYRTVKKEPHQRVRKPKWTALDLKLLEREVRLNAKVPSTGGARRGATRSKSSSAPAGQENTDGNSGMGGQMFSSPVPSGASADTRDYEYSHSTEMGYYNPGTASSSSMPVSNFHAHHQHDAMDMDLPGPPPTVRDYLLRVQTQAQSQAQVQAGRTSNPNKKSKHPSIDSSIQLPLADLSQPNVKIHWKTVSENIKIKGGTYQFGASTCKKRWDALVKEHVVGKGKDINEPFYSWLWGDSLHEYFEGDEDEEENSLNRGDGAEVDGQEDDEDEDEDGEGEYDDEEEDDLEEQE
ncbi:hypothetical protein V8F20_008576 [Naviculisporaceae sp. PSN 640]